MYSTFELSGLHVMYFIGLCRNTESPEDNEDEFPKVRVFEVMMESS
jgi:hypothetical protein